MTSRSDKEKWDAFVAKIENEATHKTQKLHMVYKNMGGILNGYHKTENVKDTILEKCKGDSAFMELLLADLEYADKHFEDMKTKKERDPTSSKSPYFEASAEEDGESEEEN